MTSQEPHRLQLAAQILGGLIAAQPNLEDEALTHRALRLADLLRGQA